jgi:hypothetical protein
MKKSKKGQEPVSWTMITIILAIAIILIALVMLKAQGGSLSNLFNRIP